MKTRCDRGHVAHAARRRWLKAAVGALGGGLGVAAFDLRHGARAASRGGKLPEAAVPSAASAPASPGALHDRMPDFWRIHDAARDLPPPERARRLVRDFFDPDQMLYRQAGMQVPDAASVERWLAQLDPIAPAVRAVSTRLAAELPSGLARFRAALPDFDPEVSPVVAMPSLFAFDGHLEPGRATLPLFFGPDGIVRYHGQQVNLDVLFSHEIFHCYQAQRNPALMLAPTTPVHGNLWIEGVATWASGRLNPDASLLHVLLDDETLLREGPRAAPRVAAAMLAHIDATDDATLRSFFTLGEQKLEWPTRAGYYVGWLAADRIGARMSLREMAALPLPDIRERLLPVLADIRDGR